MSKIKNHPATFLKTKQGNSAQQGTPRPSTVPARTSFLVDAKVTQSGKRLGDIIVYNSLQQALDLATAQNVIQVTPGNYTLPGTIKNGIRLVGLGTNKPILHVEASTPLHAVHMENLHVKFAQCAGFTVDGRSHFSNMILEGQRESCTGHVSWLKKIMHQVDLLPVAHAAPSDEGSVISGSVIKGSYYGVWSDTGSPGYSAGIALLNAGPLTISDCVFDFNVIGVHAAQANITSTLFLNNIMGLEVPKAGDVSVSGGSKFRIVKSDPEKDLTDEEYAQLVPDNNYNEQKFYSSFDVGDGPLMVGVLSDGNTTMSGVLFEGFNQAPPQGSFNGAVYSGHPGGTLKLMNSTVRGNYAGVYSESKAVLSGSTIEKNSDFGAIVFGDTLTATDNLFRLNGGGGLGFEGTGQAQITNNKFVENSTVGIYYGHGTEGTFSNNWLYRNEYGLTLLPGSAVDVTNNKFLQHKQIGLVYAYDPEDESAQTGLVANNAFDGNKTSIQLGAGDPYFASPGGNYFGELLYQDGKKQGNCHFFNANIGKTTYVHNNTWWLGGGYEKPLIQGGKIVKNGDNAFCQGHVDIVTANSAKTTTSSAEALCQIAPSYCLLKESFEAAKQKQEAMKTSLDLFLEKAAEEGWGSLP